MMMKRNIMVRTTSAIKQATRDTPIVVWSADYDPVATGHITSFARPGGRITGVSLLQSELPAKRVELLKDVLPNAKRIAVLTDTATTGQLAVAQAAAKRKTAPARNTASGRAPKTAKNTAQKTAKRAQSRAALPIAGSVPPSIILPLPSMRICDR